MQLQTVILSFLALVPAIIAAPIDVSFLLILSFYTTLAMSNFFYPSQIITKSPHFFPPNSPPTPPQSNKFPTISPKDTPSLSPVHSTPLGGEGMIVPGLPLGW